MSRHRNLQNLKDEDYHIPTGKSFEEQNSMILRENTHSSDQLFSADDYYEEEYQGGENIDNGEYYDDNGNVISEQQAKAQCVSYILQKIGGEGIYPMEVIESAAWRNFYDKHDSLDDLLQNAREIQEDLERERGADLINVTVKKTSKNGKKQVVDSLAVAIGKAKGGKKQKQETKNVDLLGRSLERKLKPNDIVAAASTATIRVGFDDKKKKDKKDSFKPIVKKKDKANRNLAKKASSASLDDKSPLGENSPLSVNTNVTTTTSAGNTPKIKRHKPKPAPSADTSMERINIVVIGHVDAGKSTLMGHLLYKLGAISDQIMHRYKRDSTNIGKGSFAFAWVLDEHEEERNRGVTIDVGVRHFDTKNRHVTILDAPGHRDFIPNMITGAAQADVALLVVDATTGSFESGFQQGGQTKEHLILARSLGISQLIIAINKLDMLEWSKNRFEEIKGQLDYFLKQLGFESNKVFYVPCSGLKGENLVEPSKEITWYKGNPIVQYIDEFQPTSREVGKPLRMSIGDVYKALVTGLTVSGRIESGAVSTGEDVLIMPIGEVCTVKHVYRHKTAVPTAFAGDNVELSLSGIEEEKLISGQIICEPDNAPFYASKFKAQIVTFNPEYPITKGAHVVLHVLHTDVPAIVKRLYATLDKQGKEVQKKPRALADNVTASVQIVTETPICLERFEDNKAFGRFLLRLKGETIAAGIVQKIRE
mmetsp:Transcript_605/g.2161  ORF Transcript_605/g.2161 Transcript_605/m.2161 type:complete len:708 (-) Transcript_605:3058-5181(-)|eukprot:CAMPEP_0117447438 /NCGR_PEP_ID=MMETSP0759-20121206/6875_1 /TAXON_ID=63605 /ORGANISM="Percolomonas cosmopolitus, Strain WS" /LENGTH=707 /DNA_ID=CAMNT_0005239773 /DNA_START=189 /DNA_END=2312 /DNA_ORIENTATION=-